MSDAIVFQKRQSCLLQGPGDLTVAALVGNKKDDSGLFD